MKSKAKCDVEISITLAGEEENLDPVPACLQSAIFSGNIERCSSTGEEIALPLRYTRLVNNNNCVDGMKDSDTLEDRERDMDTALKWIKQEMLLMKEQDKRLMKQFISLRSSIVQLRCLYELHSSNSDLSSYDGSNLSLDESSSYGRSPPKRMYLHNPEIDATEFRGRTSSLLAPKRSAVTRIKWRSNEYI